MNFAKGIMARFGILEWLKRMWDQISEKGQRLVGIFRIVEKIFPVTDKNSIYPNGY